ncbi:alpha/beta hydrolase [Lachnospiraceae bacterium 56-18]
MRYKCEQIELQRKDDGKKLYFTKFWCPASIQEKNILIIHGLTYTQHIFDIKFKDYSLCEYFAQNGYNVFRLDLSGYGRSEKYEDGWIVTTQHAAEDEIYALEKICEIQDVKKVDVLGWSWGSMTTSKVASQRPELIRGLAWFGPCFGGTFAPIPVTKPFTANTYANVVRIWQHVPGSNIDPDYTTIEPELHGMWVDQCFKYDGGHGRPNGGAKEINENGDGWLIHTKAVKVPVMIIAGTVDAYTNLDRAHQAEKELPDGTRLLILHGAGHAMFLERDYYKKAREAVLHFFER